MGVDSLLSPCGYQGSNSAHQIWQPVPLFTEPSLQSVCVFLINIIFSTWNNRYSVGFQMIYEMYSFLSLMEDELICVVMRIVDIYVEIRPNCI